VLNITSERRKEILTRAATKSVFEVANMLEKELKPKEFSDMYIAVLKTLAKDYIETKSSRSSTRSNSPVRQQETVGRIAEDNMTTQENTLMLKSKHEEADPIIDSAMEQVAAPRQQDESSEAYERRNAAAQRIRKMMDAQYQDEAMTECITQEEAETIHEINRIYPPPRNVPLLDEWNDRVSFQWLREDDIRRRGRSRIEDQRVQFRGHEAVGHQHPHFTAVAGGAPDPGDPDDDDDDDNGNGGSNNPCPDHGENHHHHSSNNNSRNGGNGGRPPPSNGGGSGNPPGNNRRESRGYSMPPPAAHRYSTPGVHEAAENHRDMMHERLYTLMRQHLTVRLTIPQGSKTQKPESDSVGKYRGGPKFNKLEDWLTNLIIMFEAEQYGGRDRDRERVLHVLQFLDGEARKWYHQHVVNIRRSQLVWTFEEVIIGLYDQFIHPSTMQDARNAFSATRYTKEMGIQGFYDTLIDHAQNMAVYPDTYQIVVTFLQKIPSYICTRMFQDGLSVRGPQGGPLQCGCDILGNPRICY
jgi:hypothetical protein